MRLVFVEVSHDRRQLLRVVGTVRFIICRSRCLDRLRSDKARRARLYDAYPDPDLFFSISLGA